MQKRELIGYVLVRNSVVSNDKKLSQLDFSKKNNNNIFS